MALARRNIDIPFAKGLGQKFDPRVLDVGAATTLSNAVQDKIGSLVKRPGALDLGVAASSIWGRTLNTAGNGNVDARLIPSPPFTPSPSLAQVNGFRMWSRNTLNGVPTAFDLDDVPPILAQRFGVNVAQKQFVCFDCATDGNKLLVVWIVQPVSGNNLAWYTVLDLTTLGTVVPPQQIPGTGSSTWNYIRLASLNLGANSNTVAVVAQSGTALQGAQFTFSTLVWTGFTSLNAGGVAVDTTTVAGTAYGNYDCCLIDASHCAVAWGIAPGAGSPGVEVAAFPMSTWSSSSSSTITPPGSSGLHINGVACAVSSNGGNNTWVAYCVQNGGTSQIRGYAVQTSAMGTVTVADTSLWNDAAGTLNYRLGISPFPVNVASGVIVVGNAVHPANATIVGRLFWGNFTTSPSFINSSSRYGLCLASKPTTIVGKNACLVCYSEGDPTFGNVTVSRTYYAVELRMHQLAATDQDVRPIATIAPRIVNAQACVGYFLPQTSPLQVLSSGDRMVSVGSSIRSAQGGFGIDVINLRYTRALWQPAMLGAATYLAGGVPCAFDGQRVTEMGFLYQPPSCGLAPSNAGGQLAATTYTYAVVYEWRDATGQRKQSRPTTASVTTTGAGTSQVTVTVPPLNLTLCQDYESGYQPYVTVAIYRDTVAAPGNPVRVFTADVPAALLNVFGSAALTYVDQASDASIQSNEALYTNGGVLDAVCPSSLSCIIAHGNRLAGIGDDLTTLWLTTQWDGGSTQPYFNDALTIPMPEPIVALMSMDGTLLAFSQSSIFAIAGDGPSNDGTGNTWGTPQRITADLGCSSDWRSLVKYHAGIVFQQGSKLYLLTRGMETQYIGGPVEDLLAANPVIASATLHAVRDELRFCCKPSETALTGVVLNYNYVTDTWSVFTYYDLDAAQFGADIDSSIDIGGTWYHVNLNGRVFQETGTYDVDSAAVNHWVTMTVASAWLKANGIQGFGRFWEALFLENQVSPHDVFISVGYNYADGFTDVRQFKASDPLFTGLGTPKPQGRVHCTNQRSESVRVQFQDGPPTGVGQTTGSGANLLSMGMLVGVLGPKFRIPANQAA